MGGEKVFEQVAAGTYDVTEQVPAGWSLKMISCSDPSGGTVASGRSAHLILSPGETVICTFVNEKCSGSP
jgi:hypothetical protein